MGEYAKRISDGQEIQIGTCESMYYLRYEDRNKVSKLPSSLDASTELNLFWRLPYPDEDSIKPGEYDDYNRGMRLYRMDLNKYAVDYSNPDFAERAGSIQLVHKDSGLLLNVPCHHGEKLPEITGAKAHWNGKGHSYELAFLKNTKDGILPVIRCRHCGNMWRMSWLDIWEYIPVEMRVRLAKYKDCVEPKAA